MSLKNVQKLIDLLKALRLTEVKMNVSSPLVVAQSSRNVRKWMAFRHGVHQIRSETLTQLDWENILCDMGGQLLIGGWHYNPDNNTWTRVLPDQYLNLFLVDHSHLDNNTVLAFDGLCEMLTIEIENLINKIK